MKIVITYGTFDLLHIGHIKLLKRAKKLGQFLAVGLSTDEFNEIKGKKSIFNYEERKEILESISYVDHVFPEKNWSQKKQDIKNLRADIFVMGSDWEGKFDELKNYCKVIYLPRTEGISSTQIKEKLKCK